MSERWLLALWLGKSAATDEHVVWKLSDGTVQCARSVRLHDVATNPEQLHAVRQRPIELPTGVNLRAVAPVMRQSDGGQNMEPVPADEVEEDAGGPQVRRWQITREVFSEYGATPHCGRCTDWSRGIRSTRMHTSACRERLERALRHHPIYGPRIIQSRARIEAGVPDGPPWRRRAKCRAGRKCGW